MKNITTGIMLAGLMAVGMQALSEDAATSTQTQQSKAMKECMEKQKATNASTTQDAMKTVCKNEIDKKGKQDGNDLATGTQAPKPPG